MKFRVERDVLAEAVAWAARSLPRRPSCRCSPGCCLERRRPTAAARCPASTTRSRPRPSSTSTVAEAGAVLVPGRLLAEITRSLPGSAGRPRHRRRPSRADLRDRPVHAADAARRRVPDAARDARGRRHASAATRSLPPSPQVAIAAGRDDTLPVLTGVRIEIDGEERHAGGDRPLPARGARAALAARPTRRCQATALVPARTLAEAAKALTGRRRGDAGAGRRAAPARACSA